MLIVGCDGGQVETQEEPYKTGLTHGIAIKGISTYTIGGNSVDISTDGQGCFLYIPFQNFLTPKKYSFGVCTFNKIPESTFETTMRQVMNDTSISNWGFISFHNNYMNIDYKGVEIITPTGARACIAFEYDGLNRIVKRNYVNFMMPVSATDYTTWNPTDTYSSSLQYNYNQSNNSYEYYIYSVVVPNVRLPFLQLFSKLSRPNTVDGRIIKYSESKECFAMIPFTRLNSVTGMDNAMPLAPIANGKTVSNFNTFSGITVTNKTTTIDKVNVMPSNDFRAVLNTKNLSEEFLFAHGINVPFIDGKKLEKDYLFLPVKDHRPYMVMQDLITSDQYILAQIYDGAPEYRCVGIIKSEGDTTTEGE